MPCKEESLCFYPELNHLVSFEVIIGGHLGYLVLIGLLRLIMKNRQALNVAGPMMFYNIIQVIASVTMTIALAPYLMNYVFNISGEFNAHIEFWILAHFLTKFLDMFDSIFMVLRKKEEQLSFLHVYHHLTIGFIWGMLLHFGYGNGTAFYGAWINSLVHALMYFHYFWTALGFRNPLKKYLTMFQMFQFATCIFHAVLVVSVDQEFSFNWAALQLCYHMTLLYLFAQFFKKDRKKDKLVKKN